MKSNVNLLPREEKTEQFKVKAIKASSVLAIILLVIVGGMSAYFYLQTSGLKSQIKVEEKRITQARARISSMESIEIVARNLYKKYVVVSGIFEDRIYYSELLEKFESMIPEGVKVDSFGFGGNDVININGTASNYLLVSDFLRNLNEDKETSEKGSLFNSAYLTSVKLNPNDSSVDYFIVVNYDQEVLKNGF